jgi:signal transduction histidine kinase
LDRLPQWVAQDRRVDATQRQQASNPRSRAIARILSRMVRSASYLESATPLTWLLLACQRMWEEDGPCPELVVALARTGVLMIRKRGDHRTGYEVARHVVEVGQALGWEPETSEARAIFANFSSQWIDPLEVTYRHAVSAHEGLRSGGDKAYACVLRRTTTAILLDIAPSVDACLEDVDAGIVECRVAESPHAEAMYVVERQVLRALAGLTADASQLDDAQFDDRQFVASLEQMPFVKIMYCARRAWLAILLGEAGALAGFLPELRSVNVEAVEGHLPMALGSAWLLRGAEPQDASQLRAQLGKSAQWFAARAADQPHNFLHLSHLVDAERAWTEGDAGKAAHSFDAAIMESRRRPRPWHQALISERAGLFHLERGLTHTGRLLLAEAMEQYREWGALGKVERMQREHGLQATSLPQSTVSDPGRASTWGSSGVSTGALDMMGVLKASQALSSETSLDRLAARVTEVLAALSGATKVQVLSHHEGKWWLLPTAVGGSAIALEDAASRTLVPVSALRYVERTGEVLVVDDAASDDRFMHDAYFADVPTCSLLVVPISSQSAARAMLVLENRLGRGSFNPQRLEAVMLIAGQLAVSLFNAQLYQSLEERVQARTRELQETQAELVATARRAGKAEIANNVLHNVGNVLNSVTVSASVVRRALRDMHSEGLARVVTMLNDHSQDLASYLAQEGRGGALLNYLNELAQSQVQASRQTESDMDRLMLGIEHIAHIVAAQQSNAGISSMIEAARPQELVEEALGLCQDAIARCGAQVVRRFEEVPVVALDKPRLLQILVNVIVNGAQAMEAVPPSSRRLTVGTAVVDGDGGQRVRITVKDEGEGISPERLTQIFAHGYTSRKDGHGFGLHASAVAAVEMGARLTAHSDGEGHGAEFTVELPLSPRAALH